MSSSSWCSPDQPGCDFTTGTEIPSSSPPPSSSGGGGFWSDLGNLAGSLGNIAGNIYHTVSQPTSHFSPNATPGAPYPVVSNGQVIGYSSTPTTPVNTSSSGNNTIIIVLVALGALLLLRR